MADLPDWSELEVTQVQGKSRLTTCKNLQPLKILNPGAHHAGCHAVLSSYGGGMVAGDVIRLRVAVGAQARFFLSTQANTRIFKSVNGAVAEQHTHGTVGENGLAVVFPDPVVLQERSRYRQRQHWTLQAGALLLLVDWLHSGRMDTGEKFAFSTFFSELKVSVGERLVLLDRFTFHPAEHIAPSPANFAEYQTVLSAYLVGDPADGRFAKLATALQALQMPGRQDVHFTLQGKSCLVAVTRVRAEVYQLRALGRSRSDLQPLCDALLQTLAADELFGSNPLQRKY